MRRLLDVLRVNWLPDPGRCVDPAEAKAALRDGMTQVNRSATGRVLWFMVALASAAFLYGWWLQTRTETISIRGLIVIGAASLAGVLYLWHWAKSVRLELYSRHPETVCTACDSRSTFAQATCPECGRPLRRRSWDGTAVMVAGAVIVALGVLAQWFTHNHVHDTSGTPHAPIIGGFVLQGLAGLFVAVLFFAIAFAVGIAAPTRQGARRLLEVLLRAAIYVSAVMLLILVGAVIIGLAMTP